MNATRNSVAAKDPSDHPAEFPGPLTRGFTGYRYINPDIDQVAVDIEDGNESALRRQISACMARSATSVRHLGWPEDPSLSIERLACWENDGVICHDPESVYIVEYSVDNITVCGVLVEVDLSGAIGSRILPHEDISATRIASMRGHFSVGHVDIEPILLVQSMTSLARTVIDRTKKTAEATTSLQTPGMRYRVWRIDDPWTTATLHAELGRHQVMVADGHHRLASHSSIGHVLAMVTDAENFPLRLGAIHRIIPEISLDEIIANASSITFRNFTSNRQEDINNFLRECTKKEFIIGDGRRWKIALLRSDEALDVSAVHTAFAPATEEVNRHWVYRNQISAAIQVAMDRRGVVILLKPPHLSSIFKHISTGRLLPEKATSFWPKPPVSMVMRYF